MCLLAGDLPGFDGAHEKVGDLLVHDAGDVERRAVGVVEAQPMPIRRVALALDGLDSNSPAD